MAAAGALFAGPALCLQHQTDVALDGEVREESGLLDGVADAAAEHDEIGGANAAAIHQNLAAGRFQ